MESTFQLFFKLLQIAQGIKVHFWAYLLTDCIWKVRIKVFHCAFDGTALTHLPKPIIWTAAFLCPCWRRKAFMFFGFGLFIVFWSSWRKL